MIFPGGVSGRLRALGLTPKKSLGQHFLVSDGALRRILEATNLRPGDLVLEIGPGLGILTEAILQQGARIVAVELDRELASALTIRFAEQTANVRIVHGDARRLDPVDLLDPHESYQVVANLPYYAAASIIRKFLESSHRPTRLVVMLQREVAQSMIGAPGRFSLLAIGIHYFGKPRLVASVPPGAFYPPPKVTSAIVCIDVAPETPLPAEDYQRFFSLVKAGFSAPRKQIRGALSQGLNAPPRDIETLLSSGGIDQRRRPATLSLQEWLTLYSLAKNRL